MRTFFLLLMIALAVAAGIALLAQQGPGYVLIAVGESTYELTFVLAIGIVVFTFVAMQIIYWLVRRILGAKHGFKGWADYRRKRGQNRTTQGLIAFIEGRWDFASKSLSKAASHSSTPLINYLFAARASSALGDAKAVTRYLKNAEETTDGAEVAIGLTQAELQYNNRQYEQALATLLRVKSLSAQHPLVTTLLAAVYEKLGDWPSVLNLLPIARRQGLIAGERIVELEKRAGMKIIAQAMDESRSIDSLTAAWKKLPDSVTRYQELNIQYAKNLIELGELRQAEVLLRDQLHQDYGAELVALYGKVCAEKPAKQLAYAEKLLKSHAHDADLLLALGRICIAQQLWGKAQGYLEQSVAEKPSVDAYAELVRLANQRSEESLANDYCAKGLALAARQTLSVESVGETSVAKSPFSSLEDIKAISAS